MRINDAISKADELRPNVISDEQKYTWLFELECEVAEIMGKIHPHKRFPENIDLLMPEAHEDVYVKYLAAKIDYYNGESKLYANDQTIFQDAMADARAWYLRNYDAKNYGNWSI